MSLPRKLKQLLLKPVLIVASVVVALLVVELALRIIGYSYPEFYIADDSRGYALRPGMQGWYQKEGRAYVTINSQGLRDAEHQVPKPPNTVRIAVLGDSYAEALQVPVENAFWFVMASRLNEQLVSTGKKIEVINFGVSGYGTGQELLTLREHVWQYEPDIVLLAFTTNNDVTDNSRELKKTSEVPYFVHSEGQLILDDSFRSSRKYSIRVSTLGKLGAWSYDHFRVAQAFAEALRSVRILTPKFQKRLTRSALTHVDDSHNRKFERSAELGIDNFVYLEPDNKVWQEAWSVTEELLAIMNQEVTAKGAKFLVVTLSNAAQVLPNPVNRTEFMQSFGIADLFYPDHRIKAVGERNGFQVINLAPSLQTYAEQNKIYLHGFESSPAVGHWNSTGHRVAGEMLAAQLLPQVGRRK